MRDGRGNFKKKRENLLFMTFFVLMPNFVSLHILTLTKAKTILMIKGQQILILYKNRLQRADLKREMQQKFKT